MKSMSESMDAGILIHLCWLPEVLLSQQHSANHIRGAFDTSAGGPE